VPGDPAGLAGAALVLGVLGMLGVLTAVGVLKAEDAAELAEELQAVNSTAIKASDAQAATCRGLGAFVIPMVSNPSINE
jgi:type II secretory pathway pseudopilin PulG